MQLNKIFRCKLVVVFTLISFTLCSCGGGSSGAGSLDTHSNVDGDVNNVSLKSSNSVVIKYKEDIFNRALLDGTTANNPLSLAGSMGINLAQASGNSLFSFSESSFRPLSATMDSALRDKKTLLNDISSSLKIANTDLGGGGELGVFNEKISTSQYSMVANVDELYLNYLKNNILNTSNLNQIDSISQSAKSYCKRIGVNNLVYLPQLSSKYFIHDAYYQIVNEDYSVTNQLKNLRKQILPSKLSAELTNNNDLMLNVNQYNAKVLDYEVNLIFTLKELYYIQIMQAALWNQRNDGCKNQLELNPDFYFANIRKDKMPDLDGSTGALDNAIAAITKEYSAALQSIIASKLLITEADMVKYLNKDITTSGNSASILDEDVFLNNSNIGLVTGKCNVTGLKFDGTSNLLSSAIKEDGSSNAAGILNLQATCLSSGGETKKVLLKNALVAYPYELNAEFKINAPWSNEITYDKDSDSLYFKKNMSQPNFHIELNKINQLINLTSKEKDFNSEMLQRELSDTVYEHWPVQSNDHVWYPGTVVSDDQGNSKIPKIQFLGMISGSSINIDNSDIRHVFPDDRPCGKQICMYDSMDLNYISNYGDWREVKPTIKDLRERLGYKKFFLASSNGHLFGVRFIFTLGNEPTSGVHSSVIHSDTPIRQYVELICMSNDCSREYRGTRLFFTDKIGQPTDFVVDLNLVSRANKYSGVSYNVKKMETYSTPQYGSPGKTIWSVKVSGNYPNKDSYLELPVVEDKLPADYNKWIENYDSSNNDYMTAVLVIGGMVLFTGLVISIAMLLSQHQPDPKNPDKLKPIEIAYSPDLKFRVIFDLNDFKLKIQSMKDGVGTDACYITSVPGATRVVFADGQVRIYQGSTLAWSNQLEYSKNNRALQWVTDTFAKLVIDNNGILMIKPSEDNKTLGFKPQKSSNKNENVLWETYPVSGVAMCASSLDSPIVKSEVEKNNGKVSPDEYSDFKPNDYTLSGTSDFSYPRDSLEDIPVGRYGLKTVLITNVSNGVLSLKSLKTDLTKSSSELYISDDKRYTTCILNGSTSLNAGESCKVAYRFDPSSEGMNLSFNVSADVVTSKGVDAKGSTMYVPVYSRVPIDKPKGDYLTKCTNITWLEGNLSALCGYNKPRSSLLYFKQCNRNPIPTDVTVKDGMLVCVSPL